MDERGWRPAELSRRTKISESHIGRLLKGKRPITPDALQAIAASFGVSVAGLKYVAGALSPEERRRYEARPPVRDAIGMDPFLSARQIEYLAALYEDLRRGSITLTSARSSTRLSAE